ncbi:glycerate kinase [Zhihengliuella salsuginis]|uniref:Glycerate kinase n=1 Tax=Zhihengliuella salsuginis TaxID=578222 RepID=A0ABQ3GJV4_9MICC|nr:glycerate kinase [Zhihengliuella salsuginis]GHD06840.1 glycerate kinase [Zhihengliuella salsuginis]
MRIVCVPDSFKGSASAAQAAAALAAGARQVYPGAEIVELPFADGGEGTLDALLAVWGRPAETVEVVDAIGRPRTARFGRSADGTTAILEAAEGNGLPHVADAGLQPLRADTYGVGLIARHLLEEGVEEILLCIGGSASTDGGLGLLAALGAHIRYDDAPSGAEPGFGGGRLNAVRSIDVTGLHPAARRVRWRIAVDVDNPLTGERGAAAVFGPQKGATGADVEVLDAGLAHLADVVAAQAGADADALRSAAGFGAAGGMPLALVPLLDAETLPGSQLVAEAVGLDAALAGADLVLTGEGALDTQSLGGKVVDAVRTRAPRGAAVVVIAGTVKLTAAQVRGAGLTAAFSIAPGAAALQDLLAAAPELIEDAAANACALLAR